MVKEARTNAYELEDTTNYILNNPPLAAKWLKQADAYMQSVTQDPSSFVLPVEYKFLKPLLETYAYNLEGFVQYLLGVRDSLEPRTEPWERVQALYRRVMGRYVQQTRRERADRAIAKAEELYGPTPFHTRLKWMSDLEHHWAKRRLDYLAEYRAKMENGRISVDDRAELLSIFWDDIETEIFNGKVPPWN